MMEEKAIDCPNCGHHFPLISNLAVGISRRQLQILTFIVGRATRGEAPPTYREISTHIGHVSAGFTFEAVDTLVELGFLIKTPGRIKGVAPTAKAWTLFIPGAANA